MRQGVFTAADWACADRHGMHLAVACPYCRSDSPAHQEEKRDRAIARFELALAYSTVTR